MFDLSLPLHFDSSIQSLSASHVDVMLSYLQLQPSNHCQKKTQTRRSASRRATTTLVLQKRKMVEGLRIAETYQTHKKNKRRLQFPLLFFLHSLCNRHTNNYTTLVRFVRFRFLLFRVYCSSRNSHSHSHSHTPAPPLTTQSTKQTKQTPTVLLSTSLHSTSQDKHQKDDRK